MITAMGEQQANYGAAVGQSLAQLGQQVGQQLAMQEYRKQAAAQLPFISEQMQLATREASEGKFGDAYSKIIGLTANPSVTQNPFILPALEMGMQAIKQGSSQAWYNLQRGGGGGGTTTATGIPAVSGATEAMYRVRGEQPPTPTVPQTTETAPTGRPPVDFNAPTDATVVEPPLPTGQGGAEEQPLAADLVNAPVQPSAQQPDPIQQQAAATTQQVMAATPSAQDRVVKGTIAGKDEDLSNWQPELIDGLSRFYPRMNLSDEIRIAPIGQKTKYSESWSGKTDEPGATFRGDKEVTVDDSMNKKALEYATALKNGVGLLTETGPAGEEKNWVDVVEEVGGIKNVFLSARADGNTTNYSVKPRGKAEVSVSKDVYDAMVRVKNLSGFSQTTGIKLMPELVGGGMGVRERKFPSMAEAAAALPAGSTAYILENGRYVPKTVGGGMQSQQFTEGMTVRQNGKTYRFTNGQWSAID
jgi:hypothetical protein